MTVSRRGRLIRWHRWLGLALLIPILFLVTTGVLITVSEWRGWQHVPVQGRLWSSWYGVPPDVPETGYNVGNQWLSRQGGLLMFNTEALTRCPDSLVAAVPYEGLTDEGLIAAVCGERLLLLGHDASLLEAISGAPGSGRRLGLDERGQLILATRSGHYRFDEFSGAWHDYERQGAEWVDAVPLPDSLRDQLAQHAPLPGISRERVVLDLHSGRLFGRAGVWVVNVAAMLMALLALTGVWTLLSRIRK